MRAVLALVFFCAAICGLASAKDYLLTDYGAVAGGKTLCTSAFVSAIAAIKTAGSGRLVVPSGTFLVGPFNVTSNMILYLKAGAVLNATTDRQYWTIIAPLPSYGMGRDWKGPRRTSLIHGYNVNNVTITGEVGAKIEGNGVSWWYEHKTNVINVTRGGLIEIDYGTNIVISNLHLSNSPWYNVYPVYCKHVKVQNMKITATSDSSNTDGVDPESSQDVLIENLYYDGGDDTIAVKSGWDCYGENFNMPSKDIVIRNVYSVNTHSVLTLGSEMSGGVINVTATNLTVVTGTRGSFLKTHTTRGGYVKQISINGLKIGNTDHSAIEITTAYGGANPLCSGTPKNITVINGINYSNVKSLTGSKSTLYAVLIQGVSSIPAHNVNLKNVHINATKGFSCTYCDGTAVNVTPTPCSSLS